MYQKFIITTAGEKLSAVVDSIRFQICPVQSLPSFPIVTQLTSEPSWGLGIDLSGNYVFAFHRPLPERLLVMQPDFSYGDLYLQESDETEEHFPLNTLDIIVYSNWLANRGDLLLHASGIAIDGKGYAFVGRSGAGKSTLASSLMGKQNVTILGEDQVALRYKDGAFWIYGTPWHITPSNCAPIGVPLEKVFFLDRNLPATISPLLPQDGFVRLLQTAFIPYYRPREVGYIMDNLERLCLKVPAYLLAFHIGDDILNNIIEA